MAIVMVMTLLPTSAFAVGDVGEPSETDSGAVFSKTVHQEDNGDVKITLEAWATGQTVVTTKQQPLDIVLVLDQSGSMADNFDKTTSRQAAMKNAVNGFIDKVAKNYTEDAAHRISIVTFGSEAEVWQNWTAVDETSTDALKNNVSELPETPKGATNVAAGMAKAQAQLNNAQTDHKKVVVVFTDGVPTTYSDFSTEVATDAIATAKELKNDQTEIYTIGIFGGADPDQLYGASGFEKNSNGTVGSYWANSSFWGIGDIDACDVPAGNRFLNYLSTNYTSTNNIGLKRYDKRVIGIGDLGWEITQNFESSNSNYYLTATDSASLNNVFTQISENINSAVNEQLDTTAVVKDTMTDYFKLPANTDDIKVYTQNYKADGNWDDRAEATGTTVNIDGQTVTVTGYDYAKHFVSETKKSDDSYGQKLVIEFTITPDLAKLAQDEAVKVDTNTGAGLYLDETAVATGESGNASFCGVKYDANDGEGTVPATEIGANGTKFTVPETCKGLTREKAVLLGFSEEKKELVTRESEAAGVVTEYTPAEGKLATLYAVWAEDENGNGTPDYKEDTYTITYAKGTTDTVNNMPDAVTGVLADTEQTVSSAQPTREGYTFSKWQGPEDLTVTDNKFTMPAKNVTFTAQWTPNDVTITFDANGGAWAEDANVADYDLKDNNTKASKKFKPSDVVEKITSDPVQAGKTFNGWYIMVSGKKEPVVWTSFIKAQLIHQHGGVIYADWTDAAPAGQCTYTTRQHYINEKGVEELAVNIMVQSAEKGTKISDLIYHLENNQTYDGQKYLYDCTKTTVNGVAYAETMTLDANGTAIDLYYYLDAWNDKDDTLTGGDGIPDKYQALVKFESADATKGTVTGKGAVQVFTFKDTDGKYLTSGNVTPSLDNVTTTPADGFAFDYWTKDGEKADPSQLIPNVNGGTTIIFMANWKSNVVTITFNANGGKWAKDVAGYTMNADKPTASDKITASKTYNPSDTVEKITPDPANGTKKFVGWGISANATEPLSLWVLSPKAAKLKELTKGTGILYAIWEDAAQPTEKLNYTIHQHYIGSNGKQDAQFNDELPKTASAGTKISDLIPAELQKNREYYYQTYIYLSSETKIVNDNVATPVADDTVLNKDNTQIHLYYYLDAWNDKNDTLTGGDDIPDKYQAVVTYKVVGGTWKDGKTDDQVQVFTLKTKNKETGVWEDVTPAPVLGDTIPTGMISSYSRTASQSWDKDITKDTKVTESVTYTYTFTKGSSGGGSSGGGGGRKPTVDIPDDVPTGLNGDDHFAYIVGYPDGNVKPGSSITRAEVATIFFRLLTEDVRTANSTQSNSLSDVSRGQWFNHAISTLSSMGIVKGNPDGTFDPDAPITRAEFAAIAARFDDKNTNTTSNFSDIASHWAKDEIGVAANKGWINGYPDSTFRPDQYITRAEAMTLVNRVLNRLPEKSEDLLDDMIKWPDNADASVWYYLAVQEATNSHDYSDKSDADKYEKWTKIRDARDWTLLEK